MNQNSNARSNALLIHRASEHTRSGRMSAIQETCDWEPTRCELNWIKKITCRPPDRHNIHCIHALHGNSKLNACRHRHGQQQHHQIEMLSTANIHFALKTPQRKFVFFHVTCFFALSYLASVDLFFRLSFPFSYFKRFILLVYENAPTIRFNGLMCVIHLWQFSLAILICRQSHCFTFCFTFWP